MSPAPSGSPSITSDTVGAETCLSAQLNPVWPRSIGPSASAAKMVSSRGGCGASVTPASNENAMSTTKQVP